MITLRDIATALNMSADEMLDMDAYEWAREIEAMTQLLEAELAIRIEDGDA